MLQEKPTDGAGQAIFEALDAPGSYRVYVEKTGFDDISEDAGKHCPIYDDLTRPLVRSSVHLDAPHVTEDAIRVMRRHDHLECSRKHSKLPGGGPGGTTLGPMFWSGEPWLLVVRDILFLLSLVLSVLILIVGFASAANSQPSFMESGQAVNI